MAKELLLNALVSVLGDYIEGITKDNLKVGVWSGKIELKNLQLNHAGIEKLKLPVSIVNGYVKSLTVSIPWTSLASQPVKIFIDGIYLLLGPLNFQEFTPNEAIERSLAHKKARLLQAEKSIELAASLTEQNDPKAATYLQNLTTKIIDNIEIKISNIHIRYEDAQSFPGELFSFGLTLENFIVTTTNNRWEETFVAREGEKKEQAIYKKAKVENFVAYWNTNSPPLSSLQFDEWMNEMQNLIYRKDHHVESLQYFLNPENSLEIKLTHHDKEGHVPRLHAAIESTKIGLSITKSQYHQIMRSLDVYNTVSVKQHLLKFRPAERPTNHETAREWWRYALVLLTNNEMILQRKTDIMRACCRYRKRYIALIKKKNQISTSHNAEVMTEADLEEIDFIERHLPIDTLIFFRQLATKEAIVSHRHIKKEEEKKAADAKKAGSGSWFGLWGKPKKSEGEPSPLPAEGDVAISQLQADLENAITSSLTDPAAFTIDVTFNSSTQLTIWNDVNKVTTIDMACVADAKIRSESLSATMSLTHLQVVDDFTPNPLIGNLVTVISSEKNDHELISPLSIEFQSNDGHIIINLKASQLQLCLNKYCIQQLLSILEIPPSASSSDILALQETQRAFQAKASVKTVSSSKQHSTATTALSAIGAPDLIRNGEDTKEVKSTLHINFDVYAPQIIVPENSVEDLGYLLLDAGHLTVNGAMGPAGMSWDVRFKSVNVAMPLHVKDINGTKPLYLIRPFDIELMAQDIDKSKADMTVSMGVTEISGELDPSKLSRLLYLTEVLSSIFEAPSITFPTENILDIPDARIADPLRPQMKFVATIPSITMDIQYGANDLLQKNVLCINFLKVDVTTRVYDMHASLELRSLSVQDLMRHESQKELASTPKSESQSLVFIDVKTISNRRSPFYSESDPYANLIEVRFGTLILNTDARNILHLRPLYEVLMGKRLTNYPPELSYDILYKKAGSGVPQHQEVLPRVGGVSGTFMKLNLTTISLELLRAELLPSHAVIESSVQDGVLESVVILDIQDLSAEVKVQSLTEATCRMRSLRIRDTRNYSEEYCFKSIFGPAVQIQSLKQCDSPSALGRHTSDESQFLDQDLLIVRFRQISSQDSQVDIKIGNIDSFVSLDTVVDLANTASAQALAVVELTAPVDEAPVIQDQTIQTPSNPGNNSMTVNVGMMSSRLILLDDPTTYSSRALSVRCSIDVTYRREDLFEGTISSVEEDICVIVNDIEGFVTLDMSLDQPHQVMDPSGLTLNLKRTIDNMIPTKTSLSLNVNGLSTRLSLHDILLTLSILQRRTIVETAPPSVEGLIGDDSTSVQKPRTLSIADKNTVDEMMGKESVPELQHLTAYSILVHIGTLSTVILNTYDGQHTPLLRLELASTSFQADGFLQDMHGQGSLILKADSFNTNVCEWEPIIDRWFPSLTLKGDDSNLKLGIESDNTLQFSLTSTLLNTISHTYSMMQSIDEGSSRKSKPDLTITNRLGVEVDINHTFSGDLLFHLVEDETLDIYLAQRTKGPLIGNGDGRTVEIISHIPSKIDLRIPLSGSLQSQIIKSVPLNVNKTFHYNLKSEIESTSPRTSQSLVDIVYEYQRYQPFGGGWKEPFMMGDPPRWCNRKGKKCTLNEVTLPDNTWEWVDDWRVDIDPKKVGKKMDAEGWDYAINFSAFNSDPRGTVQPIDYARRRRWVRSRAVSSNQKSSSVSSVEVFCEFRQLDDGSRELVLKSGLELVNDLPFNIIVWVNKDSTTGFEFGPIPSNGKFSFPLFCSCAKSLKIKHADIPCNWTEDIALPSASEDNFSKEVSCVESLDNRSIYMSAFMRRTHKLLVVNLVPSLIVTNLVPCKISYKFAIGGDDKGNRVEVAEEGSIEAGCQTKLNHLKRSDRIHAAIQVGNFEWSDYSKPIFRSKRNSHAMNVHFKNSNGLVCFILRLRVIQQKDGFTEVVIFSKNALIDYTGLGLSVDAPVEKGGSNRVIRSGGGGYDLTRQTKQLTEPIPPFHMSQFKVKSKRHYTLSTTDLHSFVYTDRKYTFSYLPPFLRGQTYVATPFDDRDLRIDGGQLIQFTLPASAYVILLFDIRVQNLPSWVEKFGFRKTIEHVVATGFHDGVFHEIHYAVFGKVFQKDEKVGLGSNHSRDSRGMYSVFVLPDVPCLELLIGNQISFKSDQFSSSAETCWWNGGCGLTLFNGESGRVSIGLEDGSGWTEKDISLKLLSTDRGTFKIIDKHSGGSYQLAYTVKPMPGIFKRTKVLSIIPRFSIVNCLDDSLLLRQKGSQNCEPVLVEPFTSKGWHKSDANKANEIQFRCGSSSWSFGTIDVGEVGTHSVFLPIPDQDGDHRGNYVVINVEVKLSNPEDNSAVSVIFWRSYTGDSSTPTPLSIRNDSDFPVLVRQADISNRLYEFKIPPKRWVPYGWANLDSPSNQRKIAITTDDSFSDESRMKLLSFSAERQKKKFIPVGNGSQKVSLTTEAHMNGIVICIANPNDEVSSQTSSEPPTSALNLHFTIALASLGLSIIADSPRRRELISLYAEEFSATYVSHPSTNEQTYQLSVMDIQVDNYCETAIYPVLLRRVDSRRRSPQPSQSPEDRPNKLPFIEVTVVERTLSGNTPCTTYEYISLRVLEFALEIDSGTIETIMHDFWCDLKFLSRDELMSVSHPAEWIKNYNGDLLSPSHRRVLVDVHRANIEARVSRMYFRELVIHPMKVSLTFMQTEYQGERDEEKSLLSPVLDIIASMATVELMEIKLNSFIVTEVVESFSTLQSRVQAKFSQDLIGQLATIAGSLTAIGSPVGLVRNIGNGVQDFFYEPYLGLVQSPEDFFLGLKKGTGSLLAGVVGGTLNSAAAIVGTASSGFAYLSGDAEFVKQRAAKRQKSDSNRDRGVAGGLKAGGKEVLSGFAGGLTGIFTKPIEEAQKDGALGFFKGLGMGVAGVAVKPVLGIADGLTTIAHGISNEVGDVASFKYVRPPRTFGRSVSDQGVMILVPVFRPDCFAQEFVRLYAKKKKTTDEYISSFQFNENQIILSDQTVFWEQPQGVWKKAWHEISHVTLEENPHSIAIYLYEDRTMQRPVIIPCQTKKNAEHVYELFHSLSHLMGNAEVMLSLEELRGHEESAKPSSSDSIFGVPSPKDQKILKFKQMTNEEILTIARTAIEKITEINTSLPHSFDNIEQILATLIFQWNSNHPQKNICCTTLVNEGEIPFQISKIHLKKGKQIHVFGSRGYDSHSQTLHPNGCLVLFATAHSRTMNDSGNVHVEITSPIFQALVSSRQQKTFCRTEASSGFKCFFRQKSSTPSGSKYVISIA